MKSISKILVVITVLLSSINAFARINNAEAELKPETMLSGKLTQNISPLQLVFDNYFSIKDALVNSDADSTAIKAGNMAMAIKAVDMSKLSTVEHNVWMKVIKDLSNNAETISKSKDISKQRAVFAQLSQNVYDLVKVSKQPVPVYYQHCPMYNKGKGGNWLSKESAIKNPFYGSKMLTCGSVIETIK